MSADGEDIVPLPHGSAVIAHSAQSDVGRVRSVNEDAFLAEAPVYLVADGMGGHARGDAASRTVVETFRRAPRAGAARRRPSRCSTRSTRSNDAVRALSDEGEEGTAVAGTTLTGRRPRRCGRRVRLPLDGLQHRRLPRLLAGTAARSSS